MDTVYFIYFLCCLMMIYLWLLLVFLIGVEEWKK